MSKIQPWLGWIAIGIGTIALILTFHGTSFESQREDRFANTQQTAAQGVGPQTGRNASGSNVQGGDGQAANAPQNNAPIPNAQQGNRFGNQSQRGSAVSGAPQREAGRSRNDGFGFFRWLNFPFKLLGGLYQLVVLALVGILGLWLLRGRRTAPAQSSGVQTTQAPSQGMPSPTGETYTDEQGDQA